MLFILLAAALIASYSSASTCPGQSLQTTDAKQRLLLSPADLFVHTFSCGEYGYGSTNQQAFVARFTPPTTNTYSFYNTFPDVGDYDSKYITTKIEILDGACIGTTMTCKVSNLLNTATAVLTAGQEYTILVEYTGSSLPSLIELNVEIKCPNIHIADEFNPLVSSFTTSEKVKNVITCAGQGSTLQDIYSSVYIPSSSGLYSVRVPNVNLGTSVGSALEIRKGTCNSLQVEYCSTSSTSSVGTNSILLQGLKTYTISLGAAGTATSLPVGNKLELTYLDTQPQCNNNAIVGSQGGIKRVSDVPVDVFLNCGPDVDVVRPAYYVSFRPESYGYYTIKLETGSNTIGESKFTVEVRPDSCHGSYLFCYPSLKPWTDAFIEVEMVPGKTYVILVRNVEGSPLSSYDDVRVHVTSSSGGGGGYNDNYFNNLILNQDALLMLVIPCTFLALTMILSLVFCIRAQQKFPGDATGAGPAKVRTLAVATTALSVVVMATDWVVFFSAFVYPFLLATMICGIVVYNSTNHGQLGRSSVSAVLILSAVVLIIGCTVALAQIGVLWIFYFIIALFIPYIAIYAVLAVMAMVALIVVLFNLRSTLRFAGLMQVQDRVVDAPMAIAVPQQDVEKAS